MSITTGADVGEIRRSMIGLFLLTVAFTSFWLGLNLAYPGLQATGIPSTAIRIAVHAVMLVGLWIAIARTGYDGAKRIRIWLAIAIPFTLWLALVWWLALDGAFRPRPPGGAPALPLAILLPLLIGIPLLLRSKSVGAVLDSVPGSWLVALQVYRIFGGIFLVAWSRGELSSTFALPAGTGDVLVGLFALPVAYLLHSGARSGAGELPPLYGTSSAWSISRSRSASAS